MKYRGKKGEGFLAAMEKKGLGKGFRFWQSRDASTTVPRERGGGVGGNTF